MKIYLNYKNVPELKSLSREDRIDVLRKCNFKEFKYTRTWIALLINSLCILSGIIIGDYICRDLGYLKFYNFIILFVFVFIGLII